MVCTPSSLAQPGAAALGAMAGEARIRQVLADAGYTRGAPGGPGGRAVQHRAGGPAMSGSMYLGAVYFDGDPGELLPAYQRMLDKFGLEALDVHLCITTDAGLTVFDACPTREIYEEFTRSETFLGAIA